MKLNRVSVAGRILQASVLLLTLLTYSTSTNACSACPRDVWDTTEYYQRAWERSAHVFVATIVSSALVPLQGGSDRLLVFADDSGATQITGRWQ